MLKREVNKHTLSLTGRQLHVHVLLRGTSAASPYHTEGVVTSRGGGVSALQGGVWGGVRGMCFYMDLWIFICIYGYLYVFIWSVCQLSGFLTKKFIDFIK